MSERRINSYSIVMFVMACIFGLLYFVTVAFSAYPVYAAKVIAIDATTIDRFKAFWTLLTVVAPVILALIAYTLNFFEYGEIGCLFGLAMLVLNLTKGIDWSSIQLFLHSLTDITFPLLIISYSVSDGEYREHIAWLLIAIGLCVLRACDMTIAMVTMNGSAVIELLMGTACIFTHIFAFLAFIPLPGRQHDDLLLASSRNNIEAYKRARM